MPEIKPPSIPIGFDMLFGLPFDEPGDKFDLLIPSITPPLIDIPSAVQSCDIGSKVSSCCSIQSRTNTPWTLSAEPSFHLSLGLPGSPDVDRGSTLCSEAYGLIRQHNKKGVDMIEIGIRLWNGFSKGDPDGNGC